MLALPKDLDDILSIADWLELTALEAGDKNRSAEDLIAAMKLSTKNSNAESLSIEVMNELERRTFEGDGGYPFYIQNSSLLQALPDWDKRVAYLFCLCLSYFGWDNAAGAPINPRKLFEELAGVAAAQYLQGRVFNFGLRCERGTAPFQQAVEELCRSLGEGITFRQRRRSRVQVKDDNIDIVAWKDFEDNKSSKLIMFGQCATGENWPHKISEMDPVKFCNLWMNESPVSPLISSYYVPQVVEPDSWEYYATYGGILFDRCRIALLAFQNNVVVSDTRYMTWCKTAFPALAS